MQQSFLAKAENLILDLSERATDIRIKVLAFLLAQSAAVSHQEIDSHFSKKDKIDRVTLYRVLDWLVEKDLVHKITGSGRALRYSANSNENNFHQHAHFKCNNCEKVVCLDDIKLQNKFKVPSGYQIQQVELTLKGLCASCS